MAQIIYCHPSRTPYEYHVFTDLDFWDARRILEDLVVVKRHFGTDPSGDVFPTQVVGNNIGLSTRQIIEKRLKKAIISPPRHIIVESIISNGVFEFEPSDYYPSHWSPSRMLYFTSYRLPLGQSALNSPYKMVRLSMIKDKIRIERVRREEKHDPIIRDKKDAKRRLIAPVCF